MKKTGLHILIFSLILCISLFAREVLAQQFANSSAQDSGCSYDVQKCQDKTATDEWEDLDDEVEDKSEATAVASMTSGKFGANSYTVYSATKGCDLNNYLPDSGSCWFCPLFRVLFNSASQIALYAYQALANGVAVLVVIAFALWLSVFVLKRIAAVEKQEPGKMLQEILLQAFKVLLVVVILKVSFFQVMQLTLSPVFKTGMDFAQLITGTSNSSCSESQPYMQNIAGYGDKLKASDTGGLPISMGKSIICTIKKMEDGVSTMIAYGRQAWCVGWTTDKAFIKYIIPSFPYVLTGMMLIAGGLVLLLAFPFCLIDCVLQMCIASALAPAALGAWAFKATSRYLKMIWDFFMNAMFNFVFLSIVIYIIITVVKLQMQGINEHAGSTTGWDFLVDPINGLAYWGVTGIKLVVVCFLGWIFLDEGKSFADSYAKAADIGGIGRSVGGVAAQVGEKAGGVAFKAGKAIGKAGQQVADHFVGSRIRNVRNNYRINRVKRKGSEIRDGSGNVIGYERTKRDLLGRKVNLKVDVDASGKEVWSKTRKNLFNNGSVRITSGSALKKREILDASGNVVSSSFKFKGNAALYMVNKDGSVNMDRINDLVRNGGLSREDVLQAVALNVLQSRGGQVDTSFKDRNVTFDHKGVMHLKQTNLDGTVSELNMVMGGPNGNQMITELKTTNKSGSYNVLYSNGIQNKNVNYKAGDATAKVSYGFNDYYHNLYTYTKPLNAKGRFGTGMDINAAMYGFDSADHRAHTAQVASGKAQTTGAVYTSTLP